MRTTRLFLSVVLVFLSLTLVASQQPDLKAREDFRKKMKDASPDDRRKMRDERRAALQEERYIRRELSFSVDGKFSC